MFFQKDLQKTTAEVLQKNSGPWRFRMTRMFPWISPQLLPSVPRAAPTRNVDRNPRRNPISKGEWTSSWNWPGAQQVPCRHLFIKWLLLLLLLLLVIQ